MTMNRSATPPIPRITSPGPGSEIVADGAIVNPPPFPPVVGAGKIVIVTLHAFASLTPCELSVIIADAE